MTAARHAAGAVASPHGLATQAGRDVLASGGSALDAAIATNAVLAVAYPHMCGIGGDLFLLHHEAATGTVRCLNASGPAPGLATPEAFAERGLSEMPAVGPLTVTVPGAVAGWAAALERLGGRPLADLLAPAVSAAEEGVPVAPRLAAWIATAREGLAADPTLRRRFLAGDGTGPAAGATLRQPELAASLRRIAGAGAGDLYRGELAAEIDRDMREAGGLLRAADLAAFEPEWAEPLRTRHAGLEVVTTPPNSQGLTALLMLDRMGEAGPPATPRYLEALVAAKRAAFALRDRFLTDPRHMAVAAADVLSGAVGIDDRAVPAPPPQGDTIYLCTVDAAGDACSLIQSLFAGFGSQHVAGATGILLHNRGRYFSLRPGAPNVIAPGKRTLHTLMASMAFDEDGLRHVYGAMGGDGQPQFNVQVLHRLLAGATPAEAVAAPRVLHGRLSPDDDPDVLRAEADYGEAATALGAVEVPVHDEPMGHAHAITIARDGSVSAGADPRSDGTAAVVPNRR